MATKNEVKGFINLFAPIIMDLYDKKEKKILPSVLIAMACLQSNYGSSDGMWDAHSVYGIKVGSLRRHYGHKWNDLAYNPETRQCYDINALKMPVSNWFRAYDSFDDSIEDCYDLLSKCSRYKDCVGEMAYPKCIKDIYDGGFYSSADCIATICNIIETNNLTKYDTELFGEVVVEEKPKFHVGDIVMVDGYYTSDSANIFCGKIRKVKIADINLNAKHPYHVVDMFTNKSYGWADENALELKISKVELEEGVYHEVVEGDTLFQIAKRYQTTVKEIVKNNKRRYPSITPSFIRTGWKLRV